MLSVILPASKQRRIKRDLRLAKGLFTGMPLDLLCREKPSLWQIRI
jgi:hypothetical protein